MQATIRAQAAEQVQAANREKQQLERQMELQYANYQAYREYTESFIRFRSEYKAMMGEVYALFQQNKYEEGRRLIAQINDRMGTHVNIRRDYSNNDYINAALTDVAAVCKKRGVEFSAVIHIPEGFFLDAGVSLGLIHHLTELLYLLLGLSQAAGRSLKVQSTQKSVWLSIVARYWLFTDALPEQWPPEINHCMDAIRQYTQADTAVLSLNRSCDGHTAEILLHLTNFHNNLNVGI